MKIIHLILGKARTARMNGINKAVHNLALHQVKLGVEAELWGITPTPQDKPEARAYGMRFFQTQKRLFKLDPALRQALRTLDPQQDRVHIHGSFIPDFYTVARHLVRCKVPFVYCPHGALSPGAIKLRQCKKCLYLFLFEAFLLRKARRVHLLGAAQFASLDKWIRVPHKVLIPNGQNLEELCFEAQALDRPEVPIVSYCGRLDQAHKGLDLLLAGFAQYRQTGGWGQLWIIGDGKDRACLQAQAQSLKVAKEVVFWGAKYGVEKYNLLAHSDAFIHCSRHEGLPTSVLEAAGLGLPCLLSSATNLGSIFDQAGAGLLIHPNHPESISRAFHDVEMLKIYDALSDYGERAKALIISQYNWSNIASTVIKKCY